MSMYSFQTASKIVAGPYTLQSLKDHLPTLGQIRSVLIITQPSLERHGFVDMITGQLKEVGISWNVNTDILPEPTEDNVNDVFNRTLKSEHYDAIIGIGGGSVLDAVKVLSVLKTNALSISDMLGIDKVTEAGIPTVLIPTTSGTGSEVTPNAIVTLPNEELKVGIVSRHLLPKLIIVDPALTLGLPKPITAATGMDAFTHSLESYISNKANPISDTFALDSIRKISRSIVTAYHEGSNMEAREDMIIGSMYGGMALTSAGTAAVHALAYPLGGKFNVAHGVANSMLLPHVMEYNFDAIIPRLAEVAEAMGLTTRGALSAEKAAEKVIEQIRYLTKELEIPQDLSEFGVQEKDIAGLAVSASKVTRLLNNNPKPLELSDMERIYRKLLS